MLIQKSITQKIHSAIPVDFLEIENESSGHHRDPDGETHFRLIVVSNDFQGKSRIDRQRLIMNLLEEERKQGLHALTLRTLTPQEWESEQRQPLGASSFGRSPSCRGGGLGR